MPLPSFKQSHTALQVSRYLLPLGVVTIVSCVLAIGSYAFLFYPSQVRLAQTKIVFQATQSNQNLKNSAWKTQQILQKVWEKMPAQKDFTGLSVAISSLAKSHNIRIPGMGYEVQELRHKLGNKGTLSFKAAGRYEDIRKFIFGLENKWPHLFIEKLTAERAKTPNEVAFTIKVATFLKDQKLPLPKRSASSL